MNRTWVRSSAVLVMVLSGCRSTITDTRRVVTGVNGEGRAVVLADGVPPKVLTFREIPGLEWVELWSTEGALRLPAAQHDRTSAEAEFIPAPGGSRFRVLRIPAATDLLLAGGLDVEAAVVEYQTRIPDLAAAHEHDEVLMHTTDTLDYVIVLQGEVWLELDDQAEVHLRAGDFVVQAGNRHAWHNRATGPCVLAVVMLGATR